MPGKQQGPVECAAASNHPPHGMATTDAPETPPSFPLHRPSLCTDLPLCYRYDHPILVPCISSHSPITRWHHSRCSLAHPVHANPHAHLRPTSPTHPTPPLTLHLVELRQVRAVHLLVAEHAVDGEVLGGPEGIARGPNRRGDMGCGRQEDVCTSSSLGDEHCAMEEQV